MGSEHPAIGAGTDAGAGEGRVMEFTIRVVLPRLALSHTWRTLLAAMLALALALVPLVAVASDVFGDVPDSLPQHDAINRVYAAGIMRACTATVPPNFCPDDFVKRAQQASQWDRALGLNGTLAQGTYVQRSTTSDRPGFVVTTVDGTGNVGSYTSAAVGMDGLPLISYQDFTAVSKLKVAHCVDVACTTATRSIVDFGNSVGWYSSLAIGADGRGLISYYDLTDANLKVLHCTDVACTTSTKLAIDGGGDVGAYTSIAIGVDGLGVISYYDATNGDLKVAHCSTVTCGSGGPNTTLDSAGNVGQHTSIAIGTDGLGLISYHDATNGDLKVAHCADLLCTSATVSTIDSTGIVGTGTSVAIGADGLGLISYRDLTNADLKVAHCSNIVCSAAAVSTLDSSGSVGDSSAIAIGEDGLGLISYFDGTNGDLKVAYCTNPGCTVARLWTLDSAGTVGGHTSVTLGTDGLGLISYHDTSNVDLKVAHCANRTCAPYVRPR